MLVPNRLKSLYEGPMPPMGLTDRGCSYAVRIADGYLPTALERLRAEGLMPMRVFYTDGGGAFSEVR